MRARLPLLAALLLAAPTAAASIDLCWGIVGACAYSNAWDAGAGSCDGGSPDWYSFRTLRASLKHDNTTRTVEARNDCDAHTRADRHWESSALRVHYTSYNATSREWQWIHLDWWGTADNTTAGSCEIQLWTYNTDPLLPTGTTEQACPAGRPPLLFRILP